MQRSVGKVNLPPLSDLLHFVGGTTVFAEIQDSIICPIWNLKPKPKKGWLKLLLQYRLLSFSVVVGLGFVLLVSLIVNGLIEGLMGPVQWAFS